MTNNISVDVLIRTRNEAEWLPLLLKSIEEQKNIIISSVVIVENNSEDDISSLLLAFNDLPITIAQYNEPYFPGRMLNYGISYIRKHRVRSFSLHYKRTLLFEHSQCLANLAKKSVIQIDVVRALDAKFQCLFLVQKQYVIYHCHIKTRSV